MSGEVTKKPVAVVFPDGNRKTFSAERWEVDSQLQLGLFAGGIEVATFHPNGWLEVFLLDAEARP
jgi:hypothetical protein